VSAPAQTPEVVTFETPAAVTPGRIYRPSTKDTYGTLDAAVAAAADGDDIWIGKGTFTGAVRPITKTLHIAGAGRDVSHLDFAGPKGLELAAPAGTLRDLDLCCATKSAVLVIRGSYAGTVTRNRIRNGREYGVRIMGSARAELVENEISGNAKGSVDIGKDASPHIR
jgi:parallel beta-helix repeat protein